MGSGSSDVRSLDREALTAPAARVDDFLGRWLARRPAPENLRAAVRYVFDGGGKRMRPLLCLHAADAVGGERSAALAPAAAIELVHAFSLVHDDLPAMDDDDLRRGRPTLHRHAERGDGDPVPATLMLGLAFEIIADRAASARGDWPGGMCGELARATNDMIAGQVHDTLPDFDRGPRTRGRAPRPRPPRTRPRALIRCACRHRVPIVGEADEAEQLDADDDATAPSVGLMFQVVDDVLDETQTTDAPRQDRRARTASRAS